MKILFCKISSMKYYKGHCEKDVPVNGGSHVDKYGYGHEEFNFMPFDMEDSGCCECVGFVEPKSNNGDRNMLHIERINGCKDLKNADCADGVLVVWCATRLQGDVTVVGWYKNATVWRELNDWTMTFNDGYEEDRCYNVRAKADDCVLLPECERNRHIWSVPSAKYTKKYGFGQSMLWYANEPEAEVFINRLVENINNYSGKNYLNTYPEE